MVVYEAGVIWFGGPNPETVRNGADHWLRTGLSALGLSLFWIPPAMLTCVFVVGICGRRKDQPQDLVGLLSGMVLESVCYALGLWAVSRMLAPLLQRAGIELILPPMVHMDDSPAQLVNGTEPALRQVVTYLGAGIYEEALFRLALFSVLLKLLRRVDLGRLTAFLLAALGSAIVFSIAHHVGPYGQEYGNYLFLFRLLAGLYFALIFHLRGFGIAVGAHACYNVMVSVT
jgi:membrane protease YdiL (CAAX protease family)